MLEQLRHKVADWITGAKSEADEVATTSGYQTLLGTYVVQSAGDVFKRYTQAERENLFRKMSVVHACVDWIATTINEADPMVIKRKGKDWDQVPDHPLVQLLSRPNPEMSYANFIYHFVSHLLLNGEAYVQKIRNRAGYPTQIWPLPSSWVEPQYDDNGQIYNYSVYRGSGKGKANLSPDDVFMSVFPDPTNPRRGLGPLQAAIRDVQLDREREDYLAEMLTNLKVPGLIFNQPEGWTPEQMADVRKALRSKVGRGKRGRELFISAGKDAAVQVMAPLKDLDWPSFSSLTETRICSVFKIAPILIGLRSGLENSTYANYREAKRAFYHSTLRSLWIMIAGAWTRGLMTHENDDPGREIWFDTSEVADLQEEQDSAAKRAVELFKGGVVTRNQARAIAGEDPLPKQVGDVLLQPVNVVEVPITGSKKEPEIEEDTEWEESLEVE